MSVRPGRRKTGGQRDGLFTFADGDTQPTEVTDNPLLRRCTWCGASPRQRCRRPVRGGGTAELFGDFHDARKETTAPPPSAAPEPRKADQ